MSEHIDAASQVTHPGPITQRDVAERAGVSPAVVSYVINKGPRTVSDDARRRVLQAIADLQYRPNVHAQSLMRTNWGSSPAERQLGVIMGGSAALLARPWFGGVLSGIYREALAQKWVVRFVHVSDDFSDPVLFNKLIHPDEVCGMILISAGIQLDTPDGRKLVAAAKERIGNVVAIGRRPEGLTSVMFNLIEAAQQAVTHLIDLGHKRIAYIGLEDRRYIGYRQALLEHGLQPDPAGIIHPNVSLNDAQAGYEHMDSLLALPQRPTALFAGADEIALGVLRRLEERGVRVPQDMAIVGVNDLAMAAYMSPPLTTIRLPREDMGMYAVRMLMELMARPSEQPVTMLLPTELIIRESCGYRLKHHGDIVPGNVLPSA